MAVTQPVFAREPAVHRIRLIGGLHTFHAKSAWLSVRRFFFLWVGPAQRFMASLRLSGSS